MAKWIDMGKNIGRNIGRNIERNMGGNRGVRHGNGNASGKNDKEKCSGGMTGENECSKGNGMTSANECSGETDMTGEAQNGNLSEEAKQYLQERIPFFANKIVEVWGEWETEKLCGSSVSFPAEGFKNFDTVRLTVTKNHLEQQEYPLRLVVHVPAKWNPSYSIQQYIKRGTREEILQYLASPEGHKEIAESVAALDQANGHEDPRD